MSERKLATIQKIEEVKSIPDADSICAYRILDWWVVDSINKYTPGELVIFLEVDSWVPTTLAPFLSKGKEPRVYNGVQGERLRTIRLRKQISQGLILPMTSVNLLSLAMEDSFYDPIGFDVTDILGIQKWERPIPACLHGVMKGNFPSFIPKTDQVRCQNIGKELREIYESGSLTFTVDEKLEGSSTTCFLKDSEFRVCSRNLELVETEDNAFWKAARRERYEEKLRMMQTDTGLDLCIQSELCAPGVQGNLYNFSEGRLYCFDIYDITNGLYFPPRERIDLCIKYNINYAPVIETDYKLPGTVAEILAFAEGKSLLNPKQEREGLVFKCNQSGFSFKGISNRYLMKSDN